MVSMVYGTPPWTSTYIYIKPMPSANVNASYQPVNAEGGEKKKKSILANGE